MNTWEIANAAREHTLASFGLTKTAKARWQKEFEAAGIKISPEDLRAIRAESHAAAPSLSPDALARNRRLRELQLQNLDRLGVVNVKNVPFGVVSAQYAGEIPSVPLTTGATIRGLKPAIARPFEGAPIERFLPKKMREIQSTAIETVPAHPVDAAINYAAAKHELGEQAHHLSSRAGDVSVRPFASHLGEAAVMAEKIPVFTDPEAAAAFSRLRTLNPDDAYIEKMMRRFGHTPGAPLPLGGKGHRRLQEAMSRYSPQVGNAPMQRLLAQNSMLRERLPMILPGSQSGYYSPKVEALVKKLAPLAESVERNAPSFLRGVLDRVRPAAKSIAAPLQMPSGSPENIMKHFSGL